MQGPFNASDVQGPVVKSMGFTPHDFGRGSVLNHLEIGCAFGLLHCCRIVVSRPLIGVWRGAVNN